MGNPCNFTKPAAPWTGLRDPEGAFLLDLEWLHDVLTQFRHEVPIESMIASLEDVLARWTVKN
jgi:hypothetical protein